MYEEFYGLEERPFSTAPLAKRYFPASVIENARTTLIRCIERAEGPALLTGPAGTGKTLLCHVLADYFRDSFRVAFLHSGQLCTRRALLQAILFELGLPYRDMEEGELRLSLIDHLEPGESGMRGLLLLVDEAHLMPLRLLEEIRMLTNFVREGQMRVRLVLCGGPSLEERFANPKLESFNQRLAARCYSESLANLETSQYIIKQLSNVGRSDELFTKEALRAIFDATDGIPRLINQVCDHTLFMAAIGKRELIDEKGVEESWADLQQLPTPWNSSSSHENHSLNQGIVEFGGLDEEIAEPMNTVKIHEAKKDTAPKLLDQHAFDPDQSSTSTPEQNLTQIQNQVEQMSNELNTPVSVELPDIENSEPEEEFRPAGTIGPEVELTFQGALNPFSEEFSEEEVVIDRYATLEAGLLGSLPKVSSLEGQEFADILKSNFVKSSQQGLEVHSESTTSKQQSPADVIAPNSQSSEEVAILGLNNDPVMPVYDANDRIATASSMDYAQTSSVNTSMTDDRDLIIIEEDPLVASASEKQASTTPPRREYHQLFAKLRRG